MKRKIVKVKVATLDTYSFSGPLNDIIYNLQVHLNEIKSKKWANPEVESQNDCYECDGSKYFILYAYREETNEELERRIKKEKRIKEKNKQKQERDKQKRLQLYEQLKKEFE